VTAPAPPSSQASRCGFARDAAGVAAVEFSFILPVALLLMALVVYGGQLYRVQRRVSLAAATVANLVAQGGNASQAQISAAEMDQILTYPQLILYPNDASAVQVVVSELQVRVANGVGTGTVVWSKANSAATQRPIGQQLSVDADIAAAFVGGAGGNVILGEVQLPFQPYNLFGSVAATTLHDSSLMIPRTAAGVSVQ
jgi:Flp pilus assembly protein TadG